MTRPLIRHSLVLSLAAVLALAACKKKEEPAVAAAPAMEAPAAPAAAPAAPAKPFDLQSVPVTTTPLPPFPFIGTPPKVGSGYPEKAIEFDRAYVVAGSGLRAVEGRVYERSFPHGTADLTPEDILKRYERDIKAMGGVKVNTMLPTDPAFLQQNSVDEKKALKRLRQFDGMRSFDQYLIRSAKGNVWIAVAIVSGGLNTRISVVEEQTFKASVAPLPR